MKFKVNELAWYVDDELNIIRCLVRKASLDKTESPIYSIAKVEHTTYGANGKPVSFVLSEDWFKHNVDEMFLFKSIVDAQEHVDRSLEFIRSSEEDALYSSRLK